MIKNYDRTLRVIVFGAGFWGQQWIKAVHSHPRCILSAVAAKSHDTPREILEFLRTNNIPCLADCHEVLSKTQADAAVVVVPPHMHYEVLSACLDHNLDILCEKPLAATWDEAVQVFRRARNHSSRKYMVSQTRRWCDHIQTLKREIDADRIGNVSFVNVDHRVHNRHPGWREDLHFPVLEDMGVHHFDAMRFYTGADPLSVYAQSWNPPWSWYKGQACSSVFFEMTEGIHINYFGSWCVMGQQTPWEGRIQVGGEKGTLDLVDEQTLHFYPAETGREPGTSPVPERIDLIHLKKREIDYCLDEFCQSIFLDRAPEISFTDNLATMAMSRAAVESSRIGQKINISAWLEAL